jgi:hypothetical protein
MASKAGSSTPPYRADQIEIQPVTPRDLRPDPARLDSLVSMILKQVFEEMAQPVPEPGKSDTPSSN